MIDNEQEDLAHLEETVGGNMKKISFVIPCYRSTVTLPGVIKEIQDTMAGMPEYSYDVILINDCSPDDTFETIKKLCDENDHITGINLAKNFGQHSALMAGFHHVTGDIVVCLDDDGQTPADEVGKLLDGIKGGADVVYASYRHKHHSGFRNFGSHINELMTRVMLGKPKHLAVSSYFAARRFVVDEMIRYEYAYPYVIGLVLRSTKNIINVDVNHRDREAGTSGYTLGKLLSLWFNGFTAFSVKPLRIATFLGGFTSFAAFIYLIVVVLQKLIAGIDVPGYATIIVLILLLGGMQLFCIGIIGEYVGRTFEQSKDRPIYIAKEILNYEKD